MISGWMLLACNFGALLFFSSNGNIFNPEMPVWPSLTKDFAWLMLLAFGAFLSPALPRHQFLVFTCIPALLILGCIFFLIGKGDGNLDLGWIKAIKNAVLYMWAPFLLASLVELQYQRLIRHLIAILFLSLLASVLIYFLFESHFKPGDPRMFGSTGNPNTAALFALLLFVLVSLCFDEMKRIQRWTCLVLVFLSMFLSASFLYLLMLTAVMGYFSLLSLWEQSAKRLRRYWVELVVAAGLSAVLVTWLVDIFSYPGVPIDLRFKSALIASASQPGVMASDSIAIRMRDVGSFAFSWRGGGGDYRQFDSALLTFAYNFGLAGALFSLYPCFCLLFVGKVNWRNGSVAFHALTITVVLMFASSLVHYQTSFFPSNVVLYMLLAFSLKEVLAQTKKSEGTVRAISPS